MTFRSPSPRPLALVFALCGVLAGCADEVQKPSPELRAEGLYIHGTALYLQGSFEESEKAFDEMRSILPEDPRLPAAYGELFLSQGRLKDALPHFERAALNEPRRPTNWSRIGFIKAQLGEADAARSALRKAVALYPRDFNALEALGELDLKEGKLDDAVIHFGLAAEASPHDEGASANHLRAAQALGEAGRDEDALAFLAKAVARNRSDAALYTEYGERLVRAGRLEEAVAALSEAAKRAPKDPGLWELVGELYTALDKPGDALGAFGQSLKIKERSVVLASMARLHRSRGDGAAASEFLDRALAAATGEDEREARELARTLMDFNRPKDALKLYQHLAEEPEREADATLQVELAKAAKKAGETKLAAEACRRAKEKDAALERCP